MDIDQSNNLYVYGYDNLMGVCYNQIQFYLTTIEHCYCLKSIQVRSHYWKIRIPYLKEEHITAAWMWGMIWHLIVGVGGGGGGPDDKVSMSTELSDGTQGSWTVTSVVMTLHFSSKDTQWLRPNEHVLVTTL